MFPILNFLLSEGFKRHKEEGRGLLKAEGRRHKALIQRSSEGTYTKAEGRLSRYGALVLSSPRLGKITRVKFLIAAFHKS
ncbi:hypothetical protein D0A37_23950 [Microcoleus vaginatus HSN003]|nr:hypothetical protein D0A37_23950 [Microcoleus vaginatus HSN003]